MERETELSGFIPLWQTKTKPQVVEEMASYSLETKRIPDPYYFLIRPDGKLLSPQTGRLVEKSVEKDSPLGMKEWRALKKIEEWDKGRSEGSAFWFSPPHPERSLFTKLVISEIKTDSDELRLFNRSLLLNIDTAQSYAVAGHLARAGENPFNLTSAEELRSNPVFINIPGFDWMDFLNSRIDDKFIWEKIITGEDITQKEKALSDFNIIYEDVFGQNYPAGYNDERVKKAVEKANEMDAFGSLPGSCPPALLLMQEQQSSFDMFFKNSQKSFPCPECHKPIDSGKGVTQCPHCGITKEEYGSKCD